MAYIKTKSFTDISKNIEHNTLLRVGGNGLSTYSHATVLLEKREPRAELFPKTITCEDILRNRLLNFRVKVDLGNYFTRINKVTITVPSIERTLSETVFINSAYESYFESTSAELLNDPLVIVSISGITENNIEKTITYDLVFNVETQCSTPVEPRCTSNSSQFIFKGASATFPVRVLVQDKQPMTLNSIEELSQCLSDHGIAINFYSITTESK